MSLDNVIKRLVGETLHAGYEDQQRWLEGIHLQADLVVSRRLTDNIRSHPTFDHLHAMESSRQEMQLIGSDCPKRKINALLNECRKVLEIVFSSLAVAYPLVGIWKRVYVPRIDRFSGRQKMEPQKDQRMVAATYEGAFRSLGFSEPFPDSLLSVKPGQIRSVSEFHNYWQMRPVLTATAMLAQRDPIHPLAEAAKICPELLTTIDEVVCAGGSASHADGDTVSPDEAEQIVEKVYDIVSVMMGLTSAESDSLNKSIKSHG